MLQRKLNEAIHMNIPEGMNEYQDHYLQLKKKSTVWFRAQENYIRNS
jgi:hypothetical protein